MRKISSNMKSVRGKIRPAYISNSQFTTQKFPNIASAERDTYYMYMYMYASTMYYVPKQQYRIGRNLCIDRLGASKINFEKYEILNGRAIVTSYMQLVN